MEPADGARVAAEWLGLEVDRNSLVTEEVDRLGASRRVGVADGRLERGLVDSSVFWAQHEGIGAVPAAEVALATVVDQLDEGEARVVELLSRGGDPHLEATFLD